MKAAEYLILYERVRVWEASSGLDDIGFYERAALPETPDQFAGEAIWVIIGGGIKHMVARLIEKRVFAALHAGRSAFDGLRHVHKARAIDMIYGDRKRLHAELLDTARQGDDAVLAWIRKIPFLGGPALSLHFAKNIGLNVAKPDVHLTRLAKHYGEPVQGLCSRLAETSGHRVSVVDYVLFRAAERGWLTDSRPALSADELGQIWPEGQC